MSFRLMYQDYLGAELIAVIEFFTCDPFRISDATYYVYILFSGIRRQSCDSISTLEPSER